MRRYILSAAVFVTTLNAYAQTVDCTNPDILYSPAVKQIARQEFVVPEVNGFHIYKADLHIHTFYSDAQVSPELRVKEAWFDGLDIIAITDHVEYRKHEGNMIAFLKGYVKEGAEPVNNNVIRKDADKRGIVSDLNVSYNAATAAAKKYGITVIHGAEITREPISIGHYNALFTEDNNKLYDLDPIQSMRNAKAQGALIMHNHPGWRRTSVESPEIEAKAYAEGLIDGIEIMNGPEFYPKVIDRAREKSLFVSSNTDIHESAAETYRAQGQRRNMTLILAENQSPEAIREALLARRTLAYSYGYLAGEEPLLKDFFKACISVRVINSNSKRVTYAFTNNSSVEFTVQGNGNPVRFLPFTTITETVEKGKKVNWTVLNLWCGENAHPAVTF